MTELSFLKNAENNRSQNINSDDNNSFFFKRGKFKYVVQCLMKAESPEIKCKLVLVSCYFTTKVATRLIKNFLNFIDLVEIYIDRGEALKIGKNNLDSWLIEINKLVKTDLKISNSNHLFHAKAYCLLSNDNQKGSLVIGSANLTNNGLSSYNGNIEILYDTQDIKKILQFYSHLTSEQSLSFMTIHDLEDFSGEDDYCFQYALVQEGCFVRKFDETINDLLSFNYKFNKTGQDKSTTDEYKKLGLKNKNVYSQNYFAPVQPKIETILVKYNTKFFIDWGMYGITTKVGYWIPKVLVGYLDKNRVKKDIMNCKIEVENELRSFFSQAEEAMIEQYHTLWIERDWLTEKFKPSNHKNMNIQQKKDHIKSESKKNLEKNINLFLHNLDKILFRYYILDIYCEFTSKERTKEIYSEIKNQSYKMLISKDKSLKINEERRKNIKEKIKDNKESDEWLQKYDCSYELLKDSCKEIFKEEMGDVDAKILPKSIFLAIENQELEFIRCWDEQTFIDLSKRSHREESDSRAQTDATDISHS